MSATILLEVWIVGWLAIWAATVVSLRADAPVHAQTEMLRLGCLGGLFWPLVLFFYIFIVPPWVVVQKLRGKSR